MRIVFVNLHANWMLLMTTFVYVFKFSPAVKHGYILRYLLNNPKYEICSFINDRGFSLLTKGSDRLQRFLNLFSVLENRIILKKNRIDPKKITVLHKASDIRPGDLVILYNVMTEEYREMENVHAFKALSMLHFHGRKEENALMEKAGVNCYFNEVNLQKTSELFRRYYHLDLPWIVHPFVYAERFKNIKPFAERQDKAFAVGTITYKTHEEFVFVYGDPCDQPMRKQIKDNKDFFADTIDCYSQDYLEGDEGKKVLPSDNKIVKAYKKIYNRFHIGRQKKYFSFNMVEKFNDYKMCIVGEEILGVPGIGFVEGMACGCAYIGINPGMYEDYGMKAGVHYIGYDGSIDDLKAKISYYQAPEHKEELEKIANAGYEFVTRNFNGDAVAESLINKLLEKQQEWLKNNPQVNL